MSILTEVNIGSILFLNFQLFTCTLKQNIQSCFDFTVHSLDDFLQMQFKFTESRLSVSLHSQQYDDKHDTPPVITCILSASDAIQF